MCVNKMKNWIEMAREELNEVIVDDDLASSSRFSFYFLLQVKPSCFSFSKHFVCFFDLYLVVYILFFGAVPF